MALSEIEKNKEKVNQAALEVIKKGAPIVSDELTVDENVNVDENVEVDTKDIEGETGEDGKFKVELGDALSTKLDNVTGSLSTFKEAVGNTFENIATEVPKRIDEIYSDKEKKRNFLRGLYIINASSGITPLSQAKSPLGKISEGLIKAEKQFTAEDIATLKAQKKEPRRYASPKTF